MVTHTLTHCFAYCLLKGKWTVRGFRQFSTVWPTLQATPELSLQAIKSESSGGKRKDTAHWHLFEGSRKGKLPCTLHFVTAVSAQNYTLLPRIQKLSTSGKWYMKCTGILINKQWFAVMNANCCGSTQWYLSDLQANTATSWFNIWYFSIERWCKKEIKTRQWQSNINHRFVTGLIKDMSYIKNNIL